MKQLFGQIFLLILPLVLVGISLEFLIREIPNDYSYKRNYLDENSNSIDILILGGSHSYYGVNPDYFIGNAFNASHVSQSLDYDFEIIKKYENNWNHLKYIMISIDYITLFSRVSLGGESWRVKNYEIYYNINKSLKKSDNSEVFCFNPFISLKRIYSYYFNKESSITCSKLGFGMVEMEQQQDLIATGMEAAKRHTKSLTKCFEENIVILKKIIDFASKNDIDVIFFTSPVYHTYLNNLNETQLNTTINTMNDIVKDDSSCFYYNLLEDSSFDVHDYRDADHLNSNGAKKLSLKLNDIKRACNQSNK